MVVLVALLQQLLDGHAQIICDLLDLPDPGSLSFHLLTERFEKPRSFSNLQMEMPFSSQIFFTLSKIVKSPPNLMPRENILFYVLTQPRKYSIIWIGNKNIFLKYNSF